MDTDAQQVRTPRRAVAWVLLVFVLGIALGAMGAYLVAGRRVASAPPAAAGHKERRARFVEQLTREVNLTADQQKQLGTILTDTQAKLRALHDQITPQAEQVRQQSREQIRALLTPEQKLKFEEFLRRLDEERKKKEQ
jgi:Spy/CpxP family protein refolding chaperone